MTPNKEKKECCIECFHTGNCKGECICHSAPPLQKAIENKFQIADHITSSTPYPLTSLLQSAERELQEKFQEMIDWNYGTIHKQYDTEETAEILEEDTKKYGEKIKSIFLSKLTEAFNKGTQHGKRE